jgi:hypothetical protein
LDKNFAAAKVCGYFWEIGQSVQTRVCCRIPGLTLKSKQPKAKVFPHLEACVRKERGIPHSEGPRKFVIQQQQQKVFAAMKELFYKGCTLVVLSVYL